MSAPPLISTIIAVKDGEPLLRDAIESVLGQRYEPLELIVVDGGSTDGSRETARSFEAVTLIEQEGDGLAGAWNQAIAASRGELIAFLDSDDVWLPGKLECQTALLADRPDLAGSDTHATFTVLPGEGPPPGFRRDLLGKDVPAHMPGALLVRREVFDEIGAFDPSYLVALDVDWFARLKDAGFVIETLPEVFVEKRFHAGNLSHMAPERYASEMIRATRESARRQRAAAAP